MPTVPRLEPQVEQKAFGNSSVSTSAPIEAFGGGQAASAYSGLNTLGAAVNSITSEMKQRADDAQTSKAYNALARKKMELQLKASQRRGEDAFGVAEEVADEFSKYSDEIYGGLANRTQQAMFEKIREREGLELSSSVEKHVFAESMKVEEETALATIKTAGDDAVLNPASAPEKIELQKATLARIAYAQGKSSEWLSAKQREVESGTHAAIIKRMISNGQDLDARSYFNSVQGGKDQLIAGHDIAEVEKILRLGSIKGESTRIVDSIMSKKLPMGESLALIKSYSKDPEIIDAARDRVKNAFADQQIARRMDQENLTQNVTELLRKSGGNWDAIDPNVKAQMDSMDIESKDKIDKYASRLRSGLPVETDWQAYYGMKTLASTPETKEVFLKTNLWAVRGDFAEPEFKELVGMQNSLRGGNDKDTDIDDYRTEQEIVNEALGAIGKDLKKDSEDAAWTTEFRNKVNRERKAAALKTGKKPTKDETKKIVADLLTEVTVKGGGFLGWWDSKKRVADLSEGDEVVLQASDIPAEDKRRITDYLRANNKAVNDKNLFEVYKHMTQARVKRVR